MGQYADGESGLLCDEMTLPLDTDLVKVTIYGENGW